jgi:hypothetical protein
LTESPALHSAEGHCQKLVSAIFRVQFLIYPIHFHQSLGPCDRVLGEDILSTLITCCVAMLGYR